jgi:hypothetical protein
MRCPARAACESYGGTGPAWGSGAARVIYYYYNETAPLYLFMAYAKATQENPSPAAMAILARLAEAAKAGIKAKQKEK